ncbi:hypothetical protein M5E88_04045 [Akkermansia muciniphila]|nr:hypothetical protein M5E88_04045 [Akkermansia muciniphila]
MEIHGSADTTRKFLTRMEDGSLVESVIIPAAAAENGEKSERVTLCVSSQVGCAFGCNSALPGCWALNATSPRGNHRADSLRGSHRGKTGQQHRLHGHGEPLSNFDNVADALKSSLPTAVWK